jgi:hypothetical protein
MTAVSVTVGTLFILLVEPKKIAKYGIILFFIIISFLIITELLLVKFNKENILLKRLTDPKLQEMTLVRSVTMPGAALVSGLYYEPLGTGGDMADYYVQKAYQLGWIRPQGSAMASHNHFANVIMYAGLFGILIIIIFVINIFSKIKIILTSVQASYKYVIIAASVTLLCHSLTHNGGFFRNDPSTIMMISLLWVLAYKNDNLPTDKINGKG